MENKRFFAYGCSYTTYAWPTWADLLGRQYLEYFNYGQPGAGNQFIFNAVMESDERHKITKDDLVIVQWSGPSREDRYKDNKWLTQGGVANYYTGPEMTKFFDFRGFVIRDLALIKATKCFLDNAGCDYRFISMVPFDSNNEYQDISNADVADVCEHYMNIIKLIKTSYIEVLGDYGQIRPRTLHGINITDNHPLPSEHYKYLQTVLPEFLVDSQLADAFDKILTQVWDTHNCGWNYDWPEVNRRIVTDRL
jgi:hypothetical protein